MALFTEQSKIIITCNKRLSAALEKEVRELGFHVTRTFSTGLELQGTLNDCIRLNLNVRCGSLVLYSLKSFHCDTPEQLYDTMLRMEWETIIKSDGYFSITSTVDHPTINNSLFANVKVKDAIVDRFRSKYNRRPDSGPDLGQVVIHLFWKNETAEIFIDTSGETLAKHGYRKIPGKAPMLEALASATLLSTNWNRRSPFVNPMSGSGTVAIEAALLATNRRPGLFRSNYSFQHVVGYEQEFYEKEKRKLIDQVYVLPDLKIIATDISVDAVNISKINASAAGVDKFIQFEVCDFRETAIPDGGNGVVYFNPEYGERLGDETELQSIYAAIGDFMKTKCKGYTGYVFTGNLDLAKKIGLKAKRRIEFYTSKIDCRLLEYELYQGSKRSDKI